jgi:hypothetical protein
MSIVVTPIITATAAEWNATTSPIVTDRVVYETDTGNYKVGNGTSIYSALPYATNMSTFTNYIFMVPLDQLGDLFVSSSSSSSSSGSGSSGSGGSTTTGLTELWTPGAPDLSTWTNINGGVSALVQNGTKGSTITFNPQNTSGSNEVQWSGLMKAAPTAPYKVLIGLSSLTIGTTAYDGSSLDNFSGNPVGIGFSDGTNALWFLPGVWSWNNGTGPTLCWSTGNFNSGNVQTMQLTDEGLFGAPMNSFYILSDDGQGNITISETNDGVTEHVLFSYSMTSDTVPDTVFNNIALIGGANAWNGNENHVGGSITNVFQYDTGVGSRAPVGPGY